MVCYIHWALRRWLTLVLLGYAVFLQRLSEMLLLRSCISPAFSAHRQSRVARTRCVLFSAHLVVPSRPTRSKKRLAQEQLESAAAGGVTPRAPTTPRRPQPFDAGPMPPNDALKAVMEVGSGGCRTSECGPMTGAHHLARGENKRTCKMVPASGRNLDAVPWGPQSGSHRSYASSVTARIKHQTLSVVALRSCSTGAEGEAGAGPGGGAAALCRRQQRRCR